MDNSLLLSHLLYRHPYNNSFSFLSNYLLLNYADYIVKYCEFKVKIYVRLEMGRDIVTPAFRVSDIFRIPQMMPFSKFLAMFLPAW